MFGSIASELNRNRKGITIVRKNGYKLVEYSTGANEESYYLIKEVKTDNKVDWFYTSPKKHHEAAIERFNKCEYITSRS